MGGAGLTQPDIDRAITGQHVGLARLTYKVYWVGPTHVKKRGGLTRPISPQANRADGLYRWATHFVKNFNLIF